MLLDVCVLTPEKVIFEGKAKAVMLPGEQGAFEIQPFHKPIMSRLIYGALLIDEMAVTVQRGIVKADKNNVTIIVE